MAGRSKALILQVDGGSRGNPGPAAIGVVIKDKGGKVLSQIGEVIGEFTNNVAEYRALIRGLEEARTLGADSVEIRSDSELLVSQVQGKFKVKSPDLGPLHLESTRLLRQFPRWTAKRVSRGETGAADALVNRALDQAFPSSSLEFSAIIEQQDKKLYVAQVPALPGVKGYGATRSEALDDARTAAIEYVKDLKAAGKPIPKEERIRFHVSGDLVG
ncbi:MAG: reverse transcriptase-like protein [Armatimonadetes bacterium]|nr:reverse transcriptase-like protein [Armatimonadota bacterium]